jgi:protein-tyrosine kinase
MEDIRQAIERAKITQPPASTRAPDPRQLRANQVLGDSFSSRPRREEVELDLTRLETNRIFAYDGKDYRSRSFDMMRTGLLRSMDGKGWTTLAITSPTAGCGKTFTAVNLALSMSRQRDRQVLLADLDLRRPHVSNYLGIKCEGSGIVDVVEGHIELQSAIVSARAGDSRLDILPTTPASNPADMVGSSGMKALLDQIKRRSQSQIAIIDLPPLLIGHDAISVLPHVDCVLLVAAVGTTKASEIKECNKYLEATEVIRFVLNKVPESADPHVYY